MEWNWGDMLRCLELDLVGKLFNCSLGREVNYTDKSYQCLAQRGPRNLNAVPSSEFG